MEASRRSKAGLLSSAKSFYLGVGQHVEAGGYPIDFTVKAAAPEPPRDWLERPDEFLYVWLIQFALGAVERHLAAGDERFLAAAERVGRRLLDKQEREGRLAGAWLHQRPLMHTYDLRPPWISAMAQGQGASLLVRLHQLLGGEDWADAAALALRPLELPVEQGGVLRHLDGHRFPEEYPSSPPSYVLNGLIFTLWGHRDVARVHRDSTPGERFAEGVDLLAATLPRWDLGYWSRYDLFPHRLPNVASSFYHSLHVNQLRALEAMTDRPEIRAVRERWERYAGSPVAPRRALLAKVAFRLTNPRNAAGRRLTARLGLGARS
jgi:hypothetical protein